MSNLNIAQEWFDIAEKDLLSAKFLGNMQPIPIEIICYHCQQAAEKYLKGFLAHNKHEIVKTHDLIILNKLCMKFDSEFRNLHEQCLRLTDYGVNIRYPYPLDLNESDMELAIKDTEFIQNL